MFIYLNNFVFACCITCFSVSAAGIYCDLLTITSTNCLFKLYYSDCNMTEMTGIKNRLFSLGLKTWNHKIKCLEHLLKAWINSKIHK